MRNIPGHTINFRDSIDGEFGNRTYLDIGGGVLYQFSRFIALTGEVLYTHLMTDGADGDAKAKVIIIYMNRSVEGRARGKGEFPHNTLIMSVLLWDSAFSSEAKSRDRFSVSFKIHFQKC